MTQRLLILLLILPSLFLMSCTEPIGSRFWATSITDKMAKMRFPAPDEYQINKNNWTEWDFKLVYQRTYPKILLTPQSGFTLFKKRETTKKTAYPRSNYYIRKVSRYYNIQMEMLPRKTEKGKRIAKAFKNSYFYTIRTVDNTIIIKFVETQSPPETEDEIYGKLLFINLANNKVLREVDFHWIPKCVFYGNITNKQMLTEAGYTNLKI